MIDISRQIGILNPEISEGFRQDSSNEEWAASPEAVPWYAAGTSFALENLCGSGKCLIIGSPIYEAELLSDRGWKVTYLDVRLPPRPVLRFVRGDLARLPFASNSFDAVSSTCVLCHVGLGRYGDPIRENGDEEALREIARVLKPEAMAALMFGPSIPAFAATVTLGNLHRIYNPTCALNLANRAGLRYLRSGLWCKDRWMTQEDLDEYVRETTLKMLRGPREVLHHCYLSMALQKTATPAP